MNQLLQDRPDRVRKSSSPLPSGLARWRAYLAKPVDGSSLAFFRICFGFLVVVEVARYFLFGWIYKNFIDPPFYFSFLTFIRPWSGAGMYWHFALVGLSAVCVMLGWFYRFAAVLLFLGFTYIFLLDKAQYLNHFYLVCLLCFLLVFVPAHSCWSIDARRAGSRHPTTIPHWNLLLLRAQVALVYFYGGIAKLNGDWLNGEPQRSWLASKSDFPVFGSLLASEGVVTLVTYGGLAVDLATGFLLFCRPTFWLGVVLALFFNLSNAYLFSIGIFPFVMLATLGLFARPDWPRRFWELVERRVPKLSRYRSRHRTIAPKFVLSMNSNAVLIAAHVYLLLQLLVPLRHLLYPGNVSWTEEGHRFSWHMMLRQKETETSFEIIEPVEGRRLPVDLGKLLSPRQYRKMASRPDMIQQLAHHIADEFQRTNGIRPKVLLRSIASLNGRPRQYLINPDVDLAAQPFTIHPNSWIVPLVK